ncbi:MAG: hypothetical protein M3O71_16660 [Bacteroidota bacterium]|nr:hypothetical protein [Bacteroidota bacterium]
MKKTLLLILSLISIYNTEAQTIPGPVEKRMTDSICISLSKIDVSKINGPKEAKDAFTNCVMQHSDMFVDLAKERNVSIEDQDAMRELGIDIGKDLLKDKCDGFLKLAVKMADKGTPGNDEESITGTFKRIDNKGFNYFVITGSDNKESSFLWLRQFPGSENYIESTTKLAGKKLKIKYRELEVYLPMAKGYYKVKEVIAIDIL